MGRGSWLVARSSWLVARRARVVARGLRARGLGVHLWDSVRSVVGGSPPMELAAVGFVTLCSGARVQRRRSVLCDTARVPGTSQTPLAGNLYLGTCTECRLHAHAIRRIPDAGAFQGRNQLNLSSNGSHRAMKRESSELTVLAVAILISSDTN
jgi:hypothetical protein